MSSGLEINHHEAVTELVLNRPPGNRIDLATLDALTDTIEGLKHKSTRAVLLRAKGHDFCQGADLTDPDLAAATRQDGGRVLARRGQALIDAWTALPMPTVVCLRGWAVGAGACLVMAADFRFAAPAARVRFPEVDRGMYLSWGILPRLVSLVGPAQAKWMALAGEAVASDMLPGTFRLSGDPEHAAASFAAQMAEAPPLAMRSIKRTLQAAAEVGQGAADGDVEAFAESVGSADFAEAISAFFEKRAPRFTGA